MIIAPFNNIPHLSGYLILAEDGAVISSYGELENDEKSADIIYKMITTSQR
jgi:ragulator complex protein LAMTOR4